MVHRWHAMLLLLFLLWVRFGDIVLVLVFDVVVSVHVGCVDAVVGVEGRECKHVQDAQAWQHVVIVSALSATVTQTCHAAELY
jgi:hypothetical protein